MTYTPNKIDPYLQVAWDTMPEGGRVGIFTMVVDWLIDNKAKVEADPQLMAQIERVFVEFGP